VALPELRPATSTDIPALLDVFFRAMEDLDERRRRALQPRSPGPLEMHFSHLLSTDPGSSIVADDHGRIVAFGILMVRDGDAFLSFLFVLPEWQGRGVGRAVLRQCLGAAGATERLSTCAEADQLVSTGLYASLGLAPLEPIYLLRGEIDDDALPHLPLGLRARPVVAESVADLDTELLGYRRPQDHRFWTGGERRGWMYEAEGGRVMGYGYAHQRLSTEGSPGLCRPAGHSPWHARPEGRHHGGAPRHAPHLAPACMDARPRSLARWPASFRPTRP
jgi:GNAT superfamily N-acetyltransferase